MADGKTDFNLRVALLRALRNPQWDQYSRVRGTAILSGDLFVFFDRLCANDEAEWLGTGPGPVQGEAGEIYLKIQNGQRDTARYGYAVQNLDGLLRFDIARVEVPELIYIADADWASGEPNEPEAVRQYRAAIEFVQWLRARADMGDSDRLVFLLSEKLELPLVFCSNDLNGMAFGELEILKQLLADDLHKEQRRAIAVKALTEMLGTLPNNDRFRHLLRNLPDFVKRVRDGYALYVAEFSYEKVRDQVEAARIEIAGKLNKTISEIQNQILAIPAAAILVATQMKSGTDNWASNLALVVASAIFVALMRMIVQNQRDSLHVLLGEIDRQSTLLRKEYKDIASRFDDVFNDLRTREDNQQRRLGWVWRLVVIGFIFSAAVAAWFSVQHASSVAKAPSIGRSAPAVVATVPSAAVTFPASPQPTIPGR